MAAVARDELILTHRHLVPVTRQRCYPVLPARIEAADMEGAGYLGLVKAADRYDPARGVAFTSFAITYIRGAMREYLRAEDYLTRPHREALVAEGLEPPPLLSLDEILHGGVEWTRDRLLIDAIPDPGPGPEEEVCERWQWETLIRAIRWLSRRDRRIVWLTEAQGMTNQQVAHCLGLSESRVCRLRLEAKRRLCSLVGTAG